jgi:O-antigen ligase
VFEELEGTLRQSPAIKLGFVATNADTERGYGHLARPYHLQKTPALGLPLRWAGMFGARDDLLARLGRPVVIDRVASVHMPADRLDFAVVLAVIALSVLVGALLVANPILAFVPIALLGGALLLTDGRARTPFVVFGGMLLLQRPGGLDTSKLAFLAACAVAFAGALANVRNLGRTPAYEAARPLLAAAVAVMALAGISLGVAYAGGTPLTEWLRDIAPYVLFASVPIFALDAQASFGTRRLVHLLVAAGLLGVTAWAVAWLQRREIAHFDTSRIAVASLFVPAALFAYAMASALHERAKRLVWLLVAAATLAVLFSTGTRTALALIAIPLAIALLVRRERVKRAMRLIALGPLAGVLTIAFAVAVITVTGANTKFNERLALVTATADSERDQSYNERVEQSRVALDAFKAHPVLGTGPGTQFAWVTQDGRQMSDFFPDTPMTFPAKFGALGLLILLFLVAMYFTFARRLGRGRPPTVAYLTLLGYLLLVAALGLLGPPFEDKGLSFGLLLILALALAEADRPVTTTPEPRLA